MDQCGSVWIKRLSANGLKASVLETGRALEGSENGHPFVFTVTARGGFKRIFLVVDGANLIFRA